MMIEILPTPALSTQKELPQLLERAVELDDELPTTDSENELFDELDEVVARIAELNRNSL